MRKAGILMFTVLLVAAMFTGCRNTGTDTTTSTATKATTPSTSSGTQATIRPTVPSTTTGTKPSSGVIPDATDVVPTPSGTDIGRGRMGPRY